MRHAAGAGRFQAYDGHPALRLGLRAAVQELQALGPQAVAQRIATLVQRLREGLMMMEAGVIIEPAGSGIVGLRVPGAGHSALVRRL